MIDVAVCLDNQSAIARTDDLVPKSGQLITDAIHKALAKLHKRRPGFRLRLFWVPGHEGVDGNELADLHAKKAAAREASPLATCTINGEPLPISAAALCATCKQDSLRQWQCRWADSPRGLRYAKFDSAPPSAKVPRMYHRLCRAQAVVLTQLCTGHVALNQYLHRIGALDSLMCVRCGEPELVEL
ncbi:hypothetical protein AURDEDRAFT_76517 [Auricularia subglabra TFB-10046 SS5]|uniref:Uncharacterized protein n=1 Tax=Auricularia subglabra (strain TFB-10046 / SS5) TaxID=717982 RepID=J0D5J9_AURST|nr:hypothetical protein AURDEDRAFT_76517 [Auricularia subglabra TFB-10046 SS5]